MESKKVKVVYLINGLGSGGAEMMLYRLLKGLDRGQFDPEVIAILDLGGPLKKRIEKLGVPVSMIGMKSKWDIAAVSRLYKCLKKSNPQILHTQLYAADIMGRVIGRLQGIPIVISSIRNIYYGSKLRDLLLKWTDRYARRTTVVSCAAAERLMESSIVPERKLLVIHNGLDPAEYKRDISGEEREKLKNELGIPENTFLLLSVGSLSRQKGYEDLFSALSLLNKRYNSYHLVIAGEGVMERELRTVVNAKGLSSNISFIGRSDDVAGLMSLADALVLTSLWEGLPGVVMEAMASGLPVVATAVGGTPELVVDGVTGYLVPAGDHSKLAEALEELINLDPQERLEMGCAGRKVIEEHFNVEKMVSAYESLYIESLNAD